MVVRCFQYGPLLDHVGPMAAPPCRSCNSSLLFTITHSSCNAQELHPYFDFGSSLDVDDSYATWSAEVVSYWIVVVDYALLLLTC
jgi:hypothetical protein